MFAIRPAQMSDIPVLETLIAASARGLGSPHYTSEQVEAALGTAWGVDSQLILDRTYFVVEGEGRAVACGGWSRRATYFGSDRQADRNPALLDPEKDAARIRAFFVLPEWARRGIGRAILARCESEAQTAGFRRAELVATLPGHRLYRQCGYEGEEKVRHVLPGGMLIDFIPMRKALTGC